MRIVRANGARFFQLSSEKFLTYDRREKIGVVPSGISYRMDLSRIVQLQVLSHVSSVPFLRVSVQWHFQNGCN